MPVQRGVSFTRISEAVSPIGEWFEVCPVGAATLESTEPVTKPCLDCCRRTWKRWMNQNGTLKGSNDWAKSCSEICGTPANPTSQPKMQRTKRYRRIQTSLCALKLIERCLESHAAACDLDSVNRVRRQLFGVLPEDSTPRPTLSPAVRRLRL